MSDQPLAEAELYPGKKLPGKGAGRQAPKREISM